MARTPCERNLDYAAGRSRRLPTREHCAPRTRITHHAPPPNTPLARTTHLPTACTADNAQHTRTSRTFTSAQATTLLHYASRIICTSYLAVCRTHITRNPHPPTQAHPATATPHMPITHAHHARKHARMRTSQYTLNCSTHAHLNALRTQVVRHTRHTHSCFARALTH